MDMVIRRFEIWSINLDPTVGSEIHKTRPCVIVSPDEANKFLDTIVALPLTSTIRFYPTRIDCKFKNKKGQIAVDQVRSLDKARLIKKLGLVDEPTCRKVCEVIAEYFAYK